MMEYHSLEPIICHVFNVMAPDARCHILQGAYLPLSAGSPAVIEVYSTADVNPGVANLGEKFAAGVGKRLKATAPSSTRNTHMARSEPTVELREA